MTEQEETPISPETQKACDEMDIVRKSQNEREEVIEGAKDDLAMAEELKNLLLQKQQQAQSYVPPQEVWFSTYYAAITGICSKLRDPKAVIKQAVAIADESVVTYIAAINDPEMTEQPGTVILPDEGFDDGSSH